MCHTPMCLFTPYLSEKDLKKGVPTELLLRAQRQASGRAKKAPETLHFCSDNVSAALLSEKHALDLYHHEITCHSFQIEHGDSVRIPQNKPPHPGYDHHYSKYAKAELHL